MQVADAQTADVDPNKLAGARGLHRLIVHLRDSTAISPQFSRLGQNLKFLDDAAFNRRARLGIHAAIVDVGITLSQAQSAEER